MFDPITTTQQFKIPNPFQDRKGHPAKVDGDPVWGVSDESVVKLDISDPLSPTVVAQAEGSYTITVSADADLGAGNVVIVGSGDGTVVAGVATVVGLGQGPIEEQP